MMKLLTILLSLLSLEAAATNDLLHVKRYLGHADTVRKMLVAGVSAQVVADALGITVEECESYR